MRSMTGFGRGDVSKQGFCVRAEMAAVNRKQLDLRLVLPPELTSLEPILRARAKQSLTRGSYSVAFVVEYPPDSSEFSSVRLNQAMVKSVLRQWQQLAAGLGIPLQPLTLRDVASIPGAISDAGPSGISDLLEQASIEAFDQATDAVRAMQESEGERLRQDMEKILRHMGGVIKEIKAKTNDALKNCRNRLMDRIRLLGLHLDTMDERLAKEVAFWAERSDIHEEITRLESHLTQMSETMRKDDAVGRSLDFLCQEMTRESNTLAAKTSETGVVHLALDLKGDVERLREQAQNVE